MDIIVSNYGNVHKNHNNTPHYTAIRVWLLTTILKAFLSNEGIEELELSYTVDRNTKLYNFAKGKCQTYTCYMIYPFYSGDRKAYIHTLMFTAPLFFIIPNLKQPMY